MRINSSLANFLNKGWFRNLFELFCPCCSPETNPFNTESPWRCHDANFVVTGGIGGCHNNLRCRTWWRNWHHDNFRYNDNCFVSGGTGGCHNMRRLIVRSREVSKPRDFFERITLKFGSAIACQISERLDKSKHEARAIEILWKLAVGCLMISLNLPRRPWFNNHPKQKKY